MTWEQFYAARVNNDESFKCFEKKYFPFFELIRQQNPQTLAETGCGIGSCTKALMKHVKAKHLLLDNSHAMLKLAEKNLGTGNYHLLHHDITKPLPFRAKFDVIHSHGVLEHFEDEGVRAIIANQLQVGDRLIHCVPSYRYTEKSFGDERLLSAAAWKRIALPDRIIEANDGFELILMWGG